MQSPEIMRNSHESLGGLLAALAPIALTSGCSSIGDFDEHVCIFESDGLANISPVSETDFVALREDVYSTGMVSATVAEWGTACATATDQAGCAAALDSLAFARLFSFGDDAVSAYDLAYTRGDEVSGVSHVALLLELLGTVDTPAEAALVAHAHGHLMPCDQDNVRRSADGFVVLATRGNTCGGNVEHYEVSVVGTGEIEVGKAEVVEHGNSNCAIGRRPDALRSRTHRARSVGDFFANAAHLEAASVHAFAQLAAELVAHGAPRRLVRAASRSRVDELRHTAAMAALARRFGACPTRPVVGLPRVRSFFEVARDNATEGCVRETFGALVATVQSMRARDARVRRALRRIAADETRHASLSWALDSWARGRLPDPARRALSEARRSAVASLRCDVACAWGRDVQTIAGMPDAEASVRMVDALDDALWRRKSA